MEIAFIKGFNFSEVLSYMNDNDFNVLKETINKKSNDLKQRFNQFIENLENPTIQTYQP